MSVCLSVCLSVIVLLLNGKRSGHVNGTDRSAIYRHVFLYKKLIFPATLPALPAKKRILLTIYFSLFSLRLIQQYTSVNGRVVKSMDLSSNVRMYAWVRPPPPTHPPFLLFFFHIFFIVFS